MPLNAADLQSIQNLIVEPLQKRFDDLHESITQQNTARDQVVGNHGQRLDRLEGNQRKALIAWGGIVVGVQFAWNLGWSKVRAWMGWK